jgi:hypothetical protein
LIETHNDVAASPGGTLDDYARHLKAKGRLVCLTEGGTELWRNCARVELLRLPLMSTRPVSRATLAELMKVRGIWVLDYLLEPSDSHPANAILYLCRDPNYDLSRLSKNGRKAIRRGLNNVTVRRVSWAELAEKGFPASVETDLRHGYKKPSEAGFRDMLELRKDTPFHEAWGAWQGDELISWLTLIKVDNWITFEQSPSRDAALRNYANNALRYETLRHLLTVEKRDVVVTGLSTIQPGLDPRRAYIYNTRMGFEAIPVHRVLAMPGWLHAFVANRPSAWCLAAMARFMPQSHMLQKVSGLSQFLLQTDDKALAWVESQSKEDED